MVTLQGLTLSTWEAAIVIVKIVFPQPAFQLLYSAHAQDERRLTWLLYIWRLAFVCCQEIKRLNLHDGPHFEQMQRECGSVNRATCHQSMNIITV